MIFLQWHNIQEKKYCLDSNNLAGKEGVKLLLMKCHGLGGNQVKKKLYFALSHVLHKPIFVWKINTCLKNIVLTA